MRAEFNNFVKRACKVSYRTIENIWISVCITFKLYLKDKEGNAISGKTSSDEEAIWYRLLDDDGTQLRDSEGVLIPDAVINNGDTFTLKAGQSLRLLNVPVGTKYKIEEITVPNGYEHMGPDQYTYMDASLVSQDKTVDGDEYYSMLPNTWDSVSLWSDMTESLLGKSISL